MNTKVIPNNSQISRRLTCTTKKGKFTFKADVFKNGEGKCELYYGAEREFVETGSIKSWLKQAKEMQKIYSALELFLIELQEVHQKAKQEKKF